MKRITSAALVMTWFGLLGCQHQSHSPLIAPVPDALSAGAASSQASTASFAVPFTLTIDPLTLSHSLIAREPTRAALAQATRFDIDLRQFMRGDSLEFTRIRRTPAGDLEITWQHAHPFPAVNMALPASNQNRADLGYTGRLLILADEVHQSFFGGEVTLDPTLLLDADGYVQPGDLLAGGSLTNDAFPYQLLSDSAKFTTDGQTFADPYGTYGFGDGWAYADLGADGLGWTGYDYIHAGQSSVGRMTFRREALAAGTLTIGLALLVQWTDPKGIAGFAGYLPPVADDPLTFAYRLPFSAIDCSQIIVPTPFELPATVGASAELTLGVRDWDAQATESADPNLADELDVALIQPGASGEPIVELAAPSLFTGTIPLSYRNLGNGVGGGPLYYSATCQNVSGATEESFGAIRVTDPENSLPARSSYHFGVDPATLAPDPARALRAETYQVLSIRPMPGPSAFPKLYSTVLVPGSTLWDGESYLMSWRPTPMEVPGTRGRDHGCLMVDIPVGAGRGLMIEKGAQAATGPGDFTMLDLPSGGNRVNLTQRGNGLRGLSPGLAVESPLGVPGTRPFIYLGTDTGFPRFLIADSVTGGFLHEPFNIGLQPPVWFTGGITHFQDLAQPAWNPVNDEEYIFSIGGGIYEVGPDVFVDGRIYRQNFQLPSPQAQSIVIPRIDGTEAALWPAFDQVGGTIYFTHIDLTTTPSDPFHIASVGAGGGSFADLPIPLPVPTTPNHRLLPMHVTVSPNGDAIAFSTIEVDITTFEMFGSADLWEWQPGVPLLVRITDTPTEWELYPAYQ